QQAEVVFVEVRDGSRGEGNALRYAVAGPRHELVIQEIEFQLDVALGIGHRRGAEPARRDVERHLPPVILHRRQGEARLAHDLRPAMQRRLRVRPIAQRQVGPGCHARSAFPASHASMRCSRKCKTRLALAPMQNHWWQVALYVTARGLGTSPMPYAKGNVELEFDFLDHRLVARTSDGATRSIPLVPRSVADFYQDYLGMLAALGVAAKIWPVPQEMADTTRFTADREHASYDPDAAQRCWRILTHADRVLP